MFSISLSSGWSLIVPIALAVIAFQIWGSYKFIANIFKWLSLALFTYVLSAFSFKPNFLEVLRGTVIPSFPLNRAFLSLTVAILGSSERSPFGICRRVFQTAASRKMVGAIDHIPGFAPSVRLRGPRLVPHPSEVLMIIKVNTDAIRQVRWYGYGELFMRRS